MHRISNFRPRWHGRTLHITVPPPPPHPSSVDIAVGPDGVTVDGRKLPGSIQDIRLRRRREHDARDRFYVVIDADETIEVPCTLDPHLAELERVLTAWVERSDVRAVWGTPELPARLIPTVTVAMQERAGLMSTVDGLVVPVTGGSVVNTLRSLFDASASQLRIDASGVVVRGKRVPYAQITEVWSITSDLVLQTDGGRLTVDTPRGMPAVLAALIDHLRQFGDPGAVEAELGRRVG